MTRSKSALALMLIVFLLIFLAPYAAAAAQPTVYRVFVDDWYGFKRAIEANYTPFKYENQTLNLNVGDTVFWVNDADNESITIVSKEGLWADAYLKYSRSSFKFVFNKSGNYEVYMKEFPRRHHQTIIVAPVETPTVTTLPPTQPPTPTGTETAVATASVAQTPAATSPEVNLWYILLAFILVALIAVLMLLKKK